VRRFIVFALTGVSMGVTLAGTLYRRWPQHAPTLITGIAAAAFAIQIILLTFDWLHSRTLRRYLEEERQRILTASRAELIERYPNDPVKVAGMMMQLQAMLKP
jgi:hypothetical protein